jgi:acyl-[acyl-carrier-protein]-phospholipid O-acyltransferase/long-chain-fatty-acid--[acyl-carrier-protein] ligase
MTLRKIKGAIPYLIVVFLNAFIDLGHKITVQNTVFKVYDGDTQIILTAILNSLILLPFILLFSPSAFVADKYPKNQVIRYTAWTAVALSCAITYCYFMGWFWPAFVMTFLLAVQSAFYSPAKYGYIKSLFGKESLGEANGYVQAVTIVAILLGTFVFSIFFESLYPSGSTDSSDILNAIAPVGWLLVINSIFELALTYRLPNKEEQDELSHFDWQTYFKGGLILPSLRSVLSRSTIRLSMIGLAVFWSVGQVLLASFPAFAKETLGVLNTVVIQGTLAATGVGIAIGASLAARWSRHHIETGLIPVGAAGIGVGLLLLPHLTTTTGHAVNFLFIGTMGGLFIVPLNALIQFYAHEDEIGKVLAANNLVQNLCMFSALILTVTLSVAGAGGKNILILTAIVAILGSGYTLCKLPQSMVRLVLGVLVSRFYKVNVQGLKNVPEDGGVLLLGNHISWLDWAIVQIACPRPVRFVMLKSIYDRWYLTWFFKLFGTIPITSGAGSARALQQVTKLLNQGHVVCIFPEGTISHNGHLGVFRHGFEKACADVNDDVVILPFYLRGLWGSRFSRSSEKLKRIRSSFLGINIIVAFGIPLPKDTKADLLKRRVLDLSISSWESYANDLPSLPHAWIHTVKRLGNDVALADTRDNTVSGHQALSFSIALAKRLRKTDARQNIGLLLPSSIDGLLANMAVLLCGKTVVNLNASASAASLATALREADIHTVFTSKTFLGKLAKKDIDTSSLLLNIHAIHIDQQRAAFSQTELLRSLLAIKFLPAWCLKRFYCKTVDTNSAAAILFSRTKDGSESGVMLSHRNIMANLKQVSDVLNTQEQDVIMASLPLSHAFGLTVTQFMPLIEGLPVICHDEPSEVLTIAKAITKYRVTLLCSTPTCLRLFTRNEKVHPLMFASLRMVVTDAEKLTLSMRTSFKAKFNLDILQGYGATETTPVASVNLLDTLDTNYWSVQVGGKPDTVGMALPGSNFKIVDPVTFEELPTGKTGMILIGGAQVMLGYLNNAEKTNRAIKVIDGTRWFITGDKGKLDHDGFLTVVEQV